MSEDAVWEKDIKKHFTGVPKNVWNIWIYGFLEMFNNAIEHSHGDTIRVTIEDDSIFKTAIIADNGIGIFNNIKSKFNLMDERDAVLELVKGKRTTDKTRHSGQGIFFTSKVFEDFMIISNGITFVTGVSRNIFTETENGKFSTAICMRLANSSDLVSRSQARRVLAGLELFKVVILDFNDVPYIGQAFADEIFRVFANMNPNIDIMADNVNPDVKYMINRAINTKL